jgi:predicted negative regulator of RcsB-dependent stress response
MSKKVKLLIGIVVIVSAGYFGYNYIMTGGARDIQTEKSEFTTSANDVFSEFSNNSETATAKYLGTYPFNGT